MKSRVILAVLIIAFALGSAFAEDPSARHKDYLALGDSVAFGFIDQAGFEYLNPANFVPYADYVGYTLRFTPTDAGCPGETSSSFVSLTDVDHGCRAYRTNFPLHVPYTTTQLAFATSFLKHHRDTRLVTVNVGANDGFILEESCAGAANPQLCIAMGAPQLFATVVQNMQAILAALRGTGFDGPIIIVNYYSLDYSDVGQTTLTAGLNQALAAPASAFGATVADVFSAFRAVVSNPMIAGKTCVAGLLNASPQNQVVCDVHPSQSGHKLIAKTIAATYVALRGHDDD